MSDVKQALVEERFAVPEGCDLRTAADDKDSFEESEHDSATFAIVVATLSVAYNLIIAVVSLYLSDGPLYVGTSVAMYAWASLLWSLLGLVGAIKKDPALIISFSQFLLLDTFVSTVCRLVVLQFFFDTFSDQNVCPAVHNPSWSSDNFRHDLITSVEEFREDIRMNIRMKRDCRGQLGIVQIVLVSVLVCVAAVQGALAVGMRRYGQEVLRRKVTSVQPDLERMVTIRDEKASSLRLEE